MIIFPQPKAQRVVDHHRKSNLPVHITNTDAIRQDVGKIAKYLKLKFARPSKFGLTDQDSHMRYHFQEVRKLTDKSRVMVLDQGATNPNDYQSKTKSSRHYWGSNGSSLARFAVKQGHEVVAVSKLPTSLSLPFIQKIDCCVAFVAKVKDRKILLSHMRMKFLPSLDPESLYQELFKQIHKKEVARLKITDPRHISDLTKHCNVIGTPVEIIITPPIIPDIEKKVFGLDIVKKPPENSKNKMDLVIVQHGGLLNVTDYREKAMIAEGELGYSDRAGGSQDKSARNSSKNPPRATNTFEPPQPTEGHYLQVVDDILHALEYVKEGGRLIYTLDTVPTRLFDPSGIVLHYLEGTRCYQEGRIRFDTYDAGPNRHQKSLIIDKVVSNE